MIEFALLSVPFFLIVGAILETALVFLAGEVLDSAVHDANRRILTGQVQLASEGIEDYRARVCDHTFGLFDCDAIHIQIVPVGGFANLESTASPVEEDCEPECRWRSPQTFDPGQGSTIVLVRAYYRWPIRLNFFGLSLANLPDGTRLLAAVRVFKNEPFSGA